MALWWDDEDAAHIRTRSTRYPGATDIEPAWTLEAAADPHRVVRDPDPKSHVGYTRIIGYSLSAGCVLTVIVDPDDNSGVTAWKTRGADLRDYLESKEAQP
ncbi:transposase [Nocardia sp. NPDC051787]|uniref:transposase n=1 Tax=Nocardia sp. NPDC051787 TaxID=3155415 RepID=UPI003427BCD0